MKRRLFSLACLTVMTVLTQVGSALAAEPAATTIHVDGMT